MGIDANSLNTLYTDLDQQICDFQKKGMSEEKALTKVLIRFTVVDGKQQIVVEKKSFWTTLKNIFIPGRKAEYDFEKNISTIKNGFPSEVKDFKEYQKYSKLAKELNTIVHHVNDERGNKKIQDFNISYVPPQKTTVISHTITMTTEKEETVRSEKPVNPPVPQSTTTSNPNTLPPKTPDTESSATINRPAPGGKSADGKLTQVRKIAMEAQLFGLQKKEPQAPKTEEVVNKLPPTARRPKGPPKNVKVTRDEAQNLIAKNSESTSTGKFGKVLTDNDELFSKFLGFSVLDNCDSDATAQTIAEEFTSRQTEAIVANFAEALKPLQSDPTTGIGGWFQSSTDYAKEGTLAYTLVADMKTELADTLNAMATTDQKVEGSLNKLAALCQKANWLLETHGKNSDEIT
ncbi:MAG: hypothetical protein LLF94_06260 [Chlamydiales bacterium]|nr:hypothetical protein [Chlamydiales bacterium]